MSERRESYTSMHETESERRFVTEMAAIIASKPQPAVLQLQPQEAYPLIGLMQ